MSPAGSMDVPVRGRVRRLWAMRAGFWIASLVRPEVRIGKGRWRRIPMELSVKFGEADVDGYKAKAELTNEQA